MKNFYTLFLVLFAFSAIAQEIEVPLTQKSLITKRTATWCSNCGNYAWDMMEGFVTEHSERAIVLNAHHSSGSAFHNQVAKDLVDNLAFSPGQPSFFVNNEFVGSGNIPTENTINNKVMDNEGFDPIVQAGIHAVAVPGATEASVQIRTEFFDDTEGEYYLSVWLAIKSITAFQASRGDYATHKNVLYSSASNSTFGDLIASGSINAGTKTDHSFSFPLNVLSADNIQVIAIIWDKQGSTYQFVNGNMTEEFSSVSSTIHLDTEIAQFAVQPNLAVNSAQLVMDIKQDLQEVTIQLINSFGQVVDRLYNGHLFAGEQTLRIERNNLSAGFYFVDIQTEKGRLVKKLVFR